MLEDTISQLRRENQELSETVARTIQPCLTIKPPKGRGCKHQGAPVLYKGGVTALLADHHRLRCIHLGVKASSYKHIPTRFILGSGRGVMELSVQGGSGSCPGTVVA